MKRSGKMMVGGLLGGLLGGPIGGAIGAGVAAAKNPKNSIMGAPEKFAETGNTLQLQDPSSFDPGQLNVPGFAGAGNFQAGNATDPGQYTSASDSTGYTNAVFRGLGIDPASTSQQVRNAGFSQLNADAHAQSVADAQNLAGMGQLDSGSAAALASRRGTALAGQRANLSMNAAIDDANRQQAYDTMGLGFAGQYGRDASGFGLNRAGMLTDASFRNSEGANAFNMGNAQMQNDYNLGSAQLTGDYNLNRSGMLADNSFRNSMAEHEANVMFPMQLAAGKKAANMQMWGNLAGGLLSAGGKAATMGAM